MGCKERKEVVKVKRKSLIVADTLFYKPCRREVKR
jgi:hypothetical protein